MKSEISNVTSWSSNINNFPARHHNNSYRDHNCDMSRVTSRLVSRVSRLRLQYSANCHGDQVSAGINHINIPNSDNFHADHLSTSAPSLCLGWKMQMETTIALHIESYFDAYFLQSFSRKWDLFVMQCLQMLWNIEIDGGERWSINKCVTNICSVSTSQGESIRDPSSTAAKLNVSELMESSQTSGGLKTMHPHHKMCNPWLYNVLAFLN